MLTPSSPQLLAPPGAGKPRPEKFLAPHPQPSPRRLAGAAVPPGGPAAAWLPPLGDRKGRKPGEAPPHHGERMERPRIVEHEPEALDNQHTSNPGALSPKAPSTPCSPSHLSAASTATSLQGWTPNGMDRTPRHGERSGNSRTPVGADSWELYDVNIFSVGNMKLALGGASPRSTSRGTGEKPQASPQIQKAYHKVDDTLRLPSPRAAVRTPSQASSRPEEAPISSGRTRPTRLKDPSPARPAAQPAAQPPRERSKDSRRPRYLSDDGSDCTSPKGVFFPEENDQPSPRPPTSYAHEPRSPGLDSLAWTVPNNFLHTSSQERGTNAGHFVTSECRKQPSGPFRRRSKFARALSRPLERLESVGTARAESPCSEAASQVTLVVVEPPRSPEPPLSRYASECDDPPNSSRSSRYGLWRMARRTLDKSVEPPEPKREARFLREEKIYDLYCWDEVLQEEGDGGKVVICRPKASPEETFDYVMKIRSKESLRKQHHEEEFRKTQVRMLNLPPHVGVLPVREFMEDEKFYYIVMDRARGGSFFGSLLEEFKDGSMPQHAVKGIMREILEAVSHLHRHRVLHRDIKPDNLCMQLFADPSSPTSEVKRVVLIDFDHADPDFSPVSPSKDHSTYGTLRFNAPESLLGEYSAASDLYSVGAILYLLMTGKMPHDDSVFEEAEEALLSEEDSKERSPQSRGCWMRQVYVHLRDQPVDWRCDPWPHLSDCRDFCARLLAFDPLERFVCAEEALHHTWLAA